MDKEQIKQDIEILKNYNKTYQERIDDLNYVIGNLKVEYPSMIIYQKGNIYLNKNFDYEKSFVTKEQVIELITLLRELTNELSDNKYEIKEIEEALGEME